MELYNIEIQKGTSYRLTVTFVDSVLGLPVDLTGYSSILSVRPDPTQPAALVLSSAATTMVLGGTAGTIVSYFNPLDTKSIDWVQAHFSLILTSPSLNKSMFMKGLLTVVNTPFAVVPGSSGGSSGGSSSITIPWNQAYYLFNTGPNVGDSGSYFDASNVDWSI